MEGEKVNISFNFDHHKESIKGESAEVYRALKTMSWRAKSGVLASD